MIIGIIGIPRELSPIRARVDGIIAQVQMPTAQMTRARWAGHDVILVECGIGKVNAALATAACIERFHPDLVMNCGSSGALRTDLALGDVVIGTEVIAHDAGVHLPDRFVLAGMAPPPGQRDRLRRLRATSAWIARAIAAAEALGWTSPGSSPRAMVGTIATGDQVIFSDAHKAFLAEATGALAVEQEGAAVAYTAYTYGVSWLVIRGISDTADGRAAFDFTRWLVFADESAQWGLVSRHWHRFRRRARHPRAWLRARRFRRGVRLATAHVARLIEQMMRALPPE